MVIVVNYSRSWLNKSNTCKVTPILHSGIYEGCERVLVLGHSIGSLIGPECDCTDWRSPEPWGASPFIDVFDRCYCETCGGWESYPVLYDGGEANDNGMCSR